MCGGEGACEKNEGGGVMKCEWWRGCMRKERRGRSNEMCVVERVHVKRMKGEE